MPCSLHFVEEDYSNRSVVGVGLRLIPGRAGAMWRVSGKNADRGGLIGWDGVPDLIRGDEGEGSGGIVLGTKVRAWVSNSSNQGSSWARESLARVWVGFMVWLADMVGWLDGGMDRLLNLDC
jgi:hypothetical protein